MQRVERLGKTKEGFVIPAGGHTGAVKRNIANPIISVAKSMAKEIRITIIPTDEIISSPCSLLLNVFFTAAVVIMNYTQLILQFDIENLCPLSN